MARRGDGPDPQPAHLHHRAILENLVIGRKHAGVGLGDGHVDPGIPHCLDGLNVVPVAVGLDDLAHVEGPAEIEQLVVLVGGVDQYRVSRGTALHDVDVVVDRPDNESVDLDRSVLVVDDGIWHGSGASFGIGRP